MGTQGVIYAASIAVLIFVALALVAKKSKGMLSSIAALIFVMLSVTLLAVFMAPNGIVVPTIAALIFLVTLILMLVIALQPSKGLFAKIAHFFLIRNSGSTG